MSRNPQFDAAVNRLARVMAITQVSMSTNPPAGLFELNLPALMSACEALETLLQDQVVPANYQVLTDEIVMGQATAELIADAISTPVPDSPEGLV